MAQKISTLSGIPYLDYDDHTSGYNAIIHYHNSMAKMYPEKYNISLHLLIQQLTARAGGKYFIDGLGLGIINVGMSQRQVHSAMENLAKIGNGKVPANNSSFTMALTNSAMKADFLDLPLFVANETIKDLVGAGKAIGDTVIEVGKNTLEATKSLSENIKWLVPVAILLAASIAVYNVSKK